MRKYVSLCLLELKKILIRKTNNFATEKENKKNREKGAIRLEWLPQEELGFRSRNYGGTHC